MKHWQYSVRTKSESHPPGFPLEPRWLTFHLRVFFDSDSGLPFSLAWLNKSVGSIDSKNNALVFAMYEGKNVKSISPKGHLIRSGFEVLLIFGKKDTYELSLLWSKPAQGTGLMPSMHHANQNPAHFEANITTQLPKANRPFDLLVF